MYLARHAPTCQGAVKRSPLNRKSPFKRKGAKPKAKRPPWIAPRGKVDLSRMDSCREAKLRAGRLVLMGCIACGRRSQVEIHHLRHGHGMAERAPWWETIPLCQEHHNGSTSGYCTHGALRREFHVHVGSEVDLLARVNAFLPPELCGPTDSR